MPDGVLKTLQSIQAKFLWGGTDLKKKLHMVAWAKITHSKSSGGLGIRNLKDMNEALLTKWWWRYGVEKDALWRKVIKSKYKGEESDWLPNTILSRQVSTIWKDILLTKVRNPAMHYIFSDNAKLLVGDGSSILFWIDEWLGSQSLASAFPPIFRVLSNQNESLRDVLSRRDNSHCWEFIVRRRLYDWEQVLMDELLTILDGSDITISMGQKDSLVWAGNSSFSVKSLYELASSHSTVTDDAFDIIWRNVAPYRVQCFCWLIHLGKIKSSEVLLNIGVIHNIEDAICKFCSLQLESVDHLLLHCNLVWNLWMEILDWWGVQWATPKSVVDLLKWWKDWDLKNDKKMIWEVTPMAILWTIWNMRNKWIFEKEAPDWHGAADTIKIRIALWVKPNLEGKGYSMDDFLFRLKNVLASL